MYGKDGVTQLQGVALWYQNASDNKKLTTDVSVKKMTQARFSNQQTQSCHFCGGGGTSCPGPAGGGGTVIM